jgi:hypothetical protein
MKRNLRFYSRHDMFQMDVTIAIQPAAAWFFSLLLCFVFALAERKNETQ